MIHNQLYRYRVRVTKIIDGDTIRCAVDVGFGIEFAVTVRLYGMNAPELRGLSRARGLESQLRLRVLLGTGPIYLESITWDKYGRCVGRLFTADGADVGETLVKEGLAERCDEDGKAVAG